MAHHHEFDIGLAERTHFDATSTIRHYDKERTSNHRLAFSVLALVIGLVSTGWPADGQGAYILVGFGIVSALIFWLISAKYSTLIGRERARARASREFLKEKGYSAIAEIDASKQAEFPTGITVSRLRLSSLWSAFYLLFILIFVIAAVNMYG